MQFSEVQLSQLRSLVCLHTRKQNEVPQGTVNQPRIEYELEFRLGTYTNETNFRSGVSESAFQRLLQSHTGHYPSFRSDCRSIRKPSEDIAYESRASVSKGKILIERMDMSEWNLRVALSKETTQWIDEKEAANWKDLVDYHQRRKQRTSFMMDHSIRLDLTHVTTTICFQHSSKIEHTYEVEIEILPHLDHEMYTPQVLKQTILPALNSVTQILQGSRFPLGSSHIHRLHEFFKNVVGKNAAEFIESQTEAELLSWKTLEEVISRQPSTVYTKANEACLTFLFVAMDTIYIFNLSSGWKQIGNPHWEIKKWNGTILVGQYDGMMFFAEEIVFHCGREAEPTKPEDFESRLALLIEFQKIARETNTLIRCKEFLFTGNLSTADKIHEMIEEQRRRGPYSLDAVVFRVRGKSFIWNLQTSFFLQYSKSTADPFLYCKAAAKAIKCPVPNFCVANNLYPNQSAQFQINRFPNQDKKIGSFELLRLCTEKQEIDTMSQVEAKMNFLKRPITQKDIANITFQFAVRQEKDIETNEASTTSFQPIKATDSSRFQRPSILLHPSPTLHKPLPTIPSSSPLLSPIPLRSKPKAVLKKKRKTKSIKWKKCSGTSASSSNLTSTTLSVSGELH